MVRDPTSAVDLVTRAQQGDQRAFETLATDCHAQLYRLAHGILREPSAAEEATQQALIDTWRTLRRLRDPAGIEGWACRWLIAACRDEARRQDHALPLQGPERQAPWTPARVPAGVSERDRLERAFGRLAVEDRAVIVLRHLVDLSPRATADALGMPVRALDSRVDAAMRSLSEAIEAVG